ncbi:amino acid ABC transporter ATP-binding protein [Microvirga sp. W0021]|uniref:Amino acid ABC transporter ATP-binding protein n=1 Tax=Hohaiivirga grylli TaxID=3133970 RepID=A0ABV0BKR8_9HYPH
MSAVDPIVIVDNISKTFHAGGRSHRALDGISTTINRGEVLVVIGPSGSGKSTFLRTLNALETIDSGSIIIDGVSLTAKKTNVDQLRTEVGMVFQHFNLFQHKSVLDNIILPQKVVRRRSEAEATKVAQDLLEKVGIPQLADRYPSQLSGGQQQRVAIARSLAMNPKIMLFDEATSALDPETVEGVLELMGQLAAEGMTMAVVTHEMQFARKVGDRILFMDNGKVVEERKPNDFFDNPQSDRAKLFLEQIL